MSSFFPSIPFRVPLYFTLLGEGRVDGAELDVGVDDVGVGVLGLDVGGGARGGGAGAASGARGGRVGGVGRVEPEHVDGVVVPDGHDEDHVLGQGVAHALEAAALVEDVGVAEGRLLRVAVLLRHRVAGHARDGALAVGHDLAVLHVEALDLAEGAARLQELRHHRQLLGRVELEAGAVERLVALAVAVEVASVGVAVARVAVGRVGAAARVAAAGVVGRVRARVRRVGRGDGVGLPDVHLGAAGAHVADAGVGVVGRRVPAIDIGLRKKKSNG